MSTIANLPIIRNYIFLRNKISELYTQNAELKHQLAEVRIQLNELRACISKNLPAEEGPSQPAEIPLSKDELSKLFLEASSHFGVEAQIHPEDHIFHFVTVHDQFRGNIAGAIQYYFSTGRESSEKLIALKNELDIRGKTSLLEFAAGYGCVTRHLKHRFNEFDITACDIHQGAVDFITNEVGAACLGSVTNPDEFKTQSQYGMVFALSFFSHMPRKTWGRWLAALFRSVAPGGHLVFTTHGLVSQEKMIPFAVINESGFWFNENSEQSDLDTADYGSTITTEKFVMEEIGKLENAQKALFHEGYWWGHQDVWAIKKLKIDGER